MFTIDLLKGQGVPVRSRPGGIAIAAVAVAVPVIVSMLMSGFYLKNRIIMSINQHQTEKWQTEIGKLSDVKEMLDSFDKEKAVCNNYLSEVRFALGKHAQWSPVLTILAEKMPESVLLTGLDVKQRFIKRKVPHKSDPEKTVDIDVPVRTLRLSVSTSPKSDGDKAVRDFRDSLRASDYLGPRLENIRVSQEFETLKGEEVVNYEIDCIFKPGL